MSELVNYPGVWGTTPRLWSWSMTLRGPATGRIMMIMMMIMMIMMMIMIMIFQ